MSLEFLVNTFEAYRQLNESHPLIAGALTAEVIFPTTNFISQKLKRKDTCWDEVIYSAKLAPFYGVLMHYVLQTNHFYDSLTDNNYVKAAFGSNFFGHGFNALLFYNNSIGSKKEYSIKELIKNYLTITPKKFLSNIDKKNYLKAAIGTVTFWNLFQGLNLTYTPNELQLPTTLVTAFFWTILLNKWSR